MIKWILAASLTKAFRSVLPSTVSLVVVIHVSHA